MEKKNCTSKRNFNFLGTLGLIFIVLRLCDLITWSWWLVLAPFWGPIALMLVVVWVTYSFEKAREYLKKLERKAHSE